MQRWLFNTRFLQSTDFLITYIHTHTPNYNGLLSHATANITTPGLSNLRPVSLCYAVRGHICQLYRVIPSVLDPRKCEYLKDYSLDFE
jgi:hypothetical protein